MPGGRNGQKQKKIAWKLKNHHGSEKNAYIA